MGQGEQHFTRLLESDATATFNASIVWLGLVLVGEAAAAFGA
jgi:hypothetical protein